MKTILWVILTLFFLIINTNNLLAQSGSKMFNALLTDLLNKRPAEKVYVHSDRDIYMKNDTVWYKIYLTNAYDNIPQGGFRNAYVELINDQNECLVRNLILCINGFGDGDFSLSNYELKQGKYKLRAYTIYQSNFGTDFYFEKNLYIKELLPSQTDYVELESETNQNEIIEDSIDFQLMPEGGYLTLNAMNTLAFKAIGTNGLSVDVSGFLKDEAGVLVDSFKTEHAGMGKLMFVPRKNKSYTISLVGYPKVHVPVPDAIKKLNMHVADLGDVINVKLLDPFCDGQTKDFCLIVNHGGINSFFAPFQMNSRYKFFNFKKELFSNGVSRLVLVDYEMKPIAERLLFVNKESALSVNIQAEKEEYGTRDEVHVNLSVGTFPAPAFSNLSVSVVNVNQVVSLEDYPENILSYLLVDSELKGHIENPSYYFKDDSISTRDKLDLLLLTQGWTNYVWEKYDHSLPDTVFQKEQGLDLSGSIERLFGKKGVDDGSVWVFMKNSGGFSYMAQTKTDDEGKFCFPSMFFPDTTGIFLQARNKNERSSTEVKEVVTFSPRPLDMPSFSDFSLPREERQKDFNRLSYIRFVEDKAYNPEKYEYLLDEIEVVKSKTQALETEDGHNRMYGMADNVLVVDEKDRSYSNIWDYIAGRVAGVSVFGNSVSIRGSVSFSEGGTEPLYLLDGIAVDKSMLDGLTMGEVDKIEVLKSPVNLAVFGMKGGNGAISVYTRRGDSNAYYERQVNGTFKDKIRGYTLSRQFYNPNYQVVNNSQGDHRATVFWEPKLKTDSLGVARFSFFTSDDQVPFQIRIEGMGSNGTPLVGYSTIKVCNKGL